MNTNHPESHQLLAFLDGELSKQEANEVKSHADSCPQCQNTLADFSSIQDLVQTAKPQLKPQPVWASVARRREKDQSWQPSVSLVFGTVAACAAGLALGLLMGEPKDAGSLVEETKAWASTDYLWSGSDSPSLYNVFSVSDSQEGTAGS